LGPAVAKHSNYATDKKSSTHRPGPLPITKNCRLITYWRGEGKRDYCWEGRSLITLIQYGEKLETSIDDEGREKMMSCSREEGSHLMGEEALFGKRGVKGWAPEKTWSSEGRKITTNEEEEKLT